MNRIRSIKPEIRRNRKIADCGVLATLLSRDLITYADDQGRFHASAREIKAECLPYFDTLKPADVEKAIQALAAPAVGFVELYEVGGERYGWMPGWFKHQQVKADRVTWSDLPPPPGFRPEMMKGALYARWLQDASKGDLPPRGDGSIVETARSQDGSKPEPVVSGLEPDRRQTGDSSGRLGDILEPRARGRTGADRTGPDQDPEGTGPEQRGRNHPPPPTVTLLPLSAEVRGRVEVLEEGCLEVLAARPLKPFERDLVLGWASTLRRGGELVPVDEVLAVVRRKMAGRTPDGSMPVNLRWCADDVATLARQRAPDAVGAAGEQLTANSRLARQIEASLLQRRQGGAAT